MTRCFAFALRSVLSLCALGWCASRPLARAQDAPPPQDYAPAPAYFAPPPPYYGSDPALALEEQERARKRAEKAARHAERLELRRQAALLTAQHRAQHRVFTHFGFAPVMVARLFPSESPRERFRHRAFTLGVAYRRHFRPELGLHAGGSVGVGASHIGLTLEPGSECCSPASERVAASYSLDTEVAPLFGPFGRSFYLAPAWVTRVIIAPDNSATLSATGLSSEPETRTVHFRSPLVTSGVRLNLGAMFGPHDEFDLNTGLEAGYAARDASRYFGFFLRFGVAFGDLARH